MVSRSVLVWVMLSAAAIATEANGLRQPDVLTFGRVRAMIVSPHPDDATLAAGGLIQRVLHGGGSVLVIQVTSGDAFSKGLSSIRPRVRATAPTYRWYGSLREREAIRAMRRLGVNRSQIRLLGFPDEGLCVLASADRAGSAFESSFTKRESPPGSEQIVPGTMYRGDDLVRELTRVIEEFRPTLVVLPHPGDSHPDHCATHLLVHQALDDAVKTGLRQPRVLHYLVHYPQWPVVERDDAPLEPPSSVHANEWSWKTLSLTPAERATKVLALDAHQSQMLIMADFLRAFERPNELFVEGEPSQSVPCWCDGANIIDRASGPQ